MEEQLDIVVRDAEIVELKERLQLLDVLSITDHSEDPIIAEPRWQAGPSLLIDSFTGEKLNVLLDGWLPSL